MGETDPREKRENQGKDSEVCKALQGNWGLQEIQGLLGYKEQRAKKEIVETVQILRLSWLT